LVQAPEFRHLTIAQLLEHLRGGALILDTRPAEQFATFHIRGSIQISLGGYFASWAAILIDPNRPLILIAEDATRAREAQIRLRRVGLTHVAGYSFADHDEW
jgi:hydroxyacylglutathione hydrolase